MEEGSKMTGQTAIITCSMRELDIVGKYCRPPLSQEEMSALIEASKNKQISKIVKLEIIANETQKVAGLYDKLVVDYELITKERDSLLRKIEVLKQIGDAHKKELNCDCHCNCDLEQQEQIQQHSEHHWNS
jgi:hypothetical protein